MEKDGKDKSWEYQYTLKHYIDMENTSKIKTSSKDCYLERFQEATTETYLLITEIKRTKEPHNTSTSSHRPAQSSGLIYI